ncbi:hypothetical protein [Okeania hirsuta]|nr:hypothetical protein [Okeania hirsuta]
MKKRETTISDDQPFIERSLSDPINTPDNLNLQHSRSPRCHYELPS